MMLAHLPSFLRSALILPCARPSSIQGGSLGKSMRLCFTTLVRNVTVAFVICAASLHSASATGTEPSTDPLAQPAPCVAAAASNDADKIIAICGALIDGEKTLKADRIKALIARAGAYDAKGGIDGGIGDYERGVGRV